MSEVIPGRSRGASGREQVTGGNATSAALGGVLGAVLGSQFGGGASAADEDCTYQVLEGAADRERIAWEDYRLRNPIPTDTRSQLLPQRGGLPGARDPGRAPRQDP